MMKKNPQQILFGRPLPLAILVNNALQLTFQGFQLLVEHLSFLALKALWKH